MKLLVLIFILVQSALAYEQKNIKINDNSYQRYIRPQITNIFSDYKKLLITFNDEFTGITKSIENINQIYAASVTNNIGSIDNVLATLYREINDSKLKEKNKLINLLVAYQKSKSSNNDLKNIYNQFYFMLIDNIDESYKNQFNLFWIDFISPLEREIIIKNNSNFLKVRLTSLNASWNSFNVHMNKRNVKLSTAQESRLEIIHRRWRSILKIVVVP